MLIAQQGKIGSQQGKIGALQGKTGQFLDLPCCNRARSPLQGITGRPVLSGQFGKYGYSLREAREVCSVGEQRGPGAGAEPTGIFLKKQAPKGI